jgi:multidrug resistance efflux pump
MRKQSQSEVYSEQFLPQKLPLSIVAIPLILFTLFLVLVLAFMPYRKQVRLQGVVGTSQPLVDITSLHLGVIREINATDGDELLPGQKLAVVRLETSTVSYASAEIKVEGLVKLRRESRSAQKQASIEGITVKIAAEEQKLKRLNEEKSKLLLLIEQQNRRVELAEIALSRYKELEDAKFVGAAMSEDKEVAKIEQIQRLEEYRRSLGMVEREITQALYLIQEFRTQVKRDSSLFDTSLIDDSLALVSAEANTEAIVRTLIGGTLLSVNSSIGVKVAPNQIMFTILPTGAKLVVEVFVPSQYLAGLEPGTPAKVKLVNRINEVEKFIDGKILWIALEPVRFSTSPLNPYLPHNSAGQATETFYKAKIELHADLVKSEYAKKHIRVGTPIEALIYSDERTVGEWLFARIFRE